MVRAGSTLADAAAAVGVTTKSISESYRMLFGSRPYVIRPAHAKRDRILELARFGASHTRIAIDLQVSKAFVIRATRAAGIVAVDGRRENRSPVGRVCGGGHCSACGGAGHRSVHGNCSRSYLASVDVAAGMPIADAATKHGIHVETVRARVIDDEFRQIGGAR